MKNIIQKIKHKHKKKSTSQNITYLEYNGVLMDAVTGQPTNIPYYHIKRKEK